MTDMKRITVSFTDELNDKIEEMRNRGPYKGKSYSQVVRSLVARGIVYAAGAAQTEEPREEAV